MASFPARPGATASRRADQPPPIRRAAPGGSSRTRATARQSAVDGNAPGHPSESVLPRRDRAERGPGRPGSPYASADVPAIRPVQPYAAMPVSASRAESSARRRPGTHPTAPSRNRPNWMICIPGYIAAGDVKPRLFGLHQHRHSGGQAFRNARSSQRMIIDAGEVRRRATLHPARESGRGLPRTPQNPTSPPPGGVPHRNPTDETALY